jgi:glyoxylase-like metal-dependent hydrolase (beta-lactamase superfamily II)
MTDLIQRIDRVQTGSAELHVQHVEGSNWHSLLWIFFGRDWVKVPVHVFVVHHRDGVVLIDAGMSPRVATDPDYWPDAITRTFMNKIFRFEIREDDRLGHRLTQAGVPPESIAKAVISHLHFDHVGGIDDILGAELLASREAWEHMLGPHPEREAVLRRDIEIPGAKWTQVEFEPLADESLSPFTVGYDLMGDRSIVLLPTPGHLDGSMSAFVRADPPILFVSDLCYREELLMKEQFPGTGEHDVLAESWRKVRALKERLPNLLVVPTHDTEAAEKLSSHPLAAR